MCCKLSRLCRVLCLMLLCMGAMLRAAETGRNSVVIGIVPTEGDAGLAVREVVPETPAAAAGVCAEDELLALNGETLSDRAHLVAALKKLRAGEPALLRVRRGGQVKELSLIPALRASALPQRSADTAAPAQGLRPLTAEIRAALAALPEKADSEALRTTLRRMQELTEADAAVRGVGVLRLRDAQGYLELREQAGSIVLEAYDTAGTLLSRAALDTPAQCRALSPELQARCHALVSVEHYSRAERSGIRPADTVLSINGTEVTDGASFRHLMDTAPDGALVEVLRIDHTEVLALAKKDYKKPRRSLKADWDALDAQEEKTDTARRALLYEFAQPHPDPLVLLRAWQQLDCRGILTLVDSEGALYFYRERDTIVLKVPEGKGHYATYRSDLPLPKALRARLLNFRF